MYSNVNAEESVLHDANTEDSEFPVTLISPDTQMSIVPSFSSLNQGGSVPPNF